MSCEMTAQTVYLKNKKINHNINVRYHCRGYAFSMKYYVILSGNENNVKLRHLKIPDKLSRQSS